MAVELQALAVQPFTYVVNAQGQFLQNSSQRIAYKLDGSAVSCLIPEISQQLLLGSIVGVNLLDHHLNEHLHPGLAICIDDDSGPIRK